MDLTHIQAPAKINLTLSIEGQRLDGYHTIGSVVTFTELHDVLSITPSDELTLTMDGPTAAPLQQEITQNSVLMAAQLLQKKCKTPKGAAIHLTKNIPVQAGLGGGSTNAAAALRGLNVLWELHLREKELARLALRIGADVPVCLGGVPAFISGVGEEIQPISNLPSFHLVLVNPMVPLCTRHVFKRGFSHYSKEHGHLVPHTQNDWLPFIIKHGNDMETNAKSLAPEIWQVLDDIASFPKCLLSRMSGSGATCYGIFGSHEDAHEAATQIQEECPDWWVHTTATLASIR